MSETDDVFTSGAQEDFKFCVHLALFGISLSCALYNGGAWLGRKSDRHLAVNTIAYLGVTAWELAQLRRHRQGGVSCG